MAPIEIYTYSHTLSRHDSLPILLEVFMAYGLYQHFPDEPEGKLSQRLNAWVEGETCAEIARQIGLSRHIRLGKQALDDGAADSDNVLGDVIESLIGALYLDAGKIGRAHV